MKQKRNISIADLLAAAIKAEAGATQYSSLNLVYNPAAAMNADRQAVVDAQAALAGARKGLRDRKVTLEQKKKVAREFLTLARDNFKSVFGRKPSEQWEVLGYRGSLAVPREPEKLLVIAEGTATFLGEQTAMEVATKGITGAQATIVFNEFRNAYTALDTQETLVASLKNDRDAAVAALRRRLSSLFSELSKIFTATDPRWLAFGFNIPGLEQTPEVPTNVLAILVGPTAASVKWGRGERANFYRLWKRVVGTDAELIEVATTNDLDFTLEGLPSNATIEVAVSAVNGGGESGKTEVVVVQTA